MSDAKHTPGPWVYGGALFDARVLAKEAPPSWSTRTIAVVDHTEDEMGDANAHLIAAAPDMFTALERLLGHYVALAESGDAGFWNPEMEPQVIAARAAIKKARGEK